jgi:PhzF family phenazine biosynthesis protein
MTIPYFEVVAFTSRHFSGNPAAVCLLTEKWLPDQLMQRVAAENNLPETAFVVERERYFDLRWMTPTVEVDLCGHATLASAHVIFNHLKRAGESVRFQSTSDEVRVDRRKSS